MRFLWDRFQEATINPHIAATHRPNTFETAIRLLLERSIFYADPKTDAGLKHRQNGYCLDFALHDTLIDAFGCNVECFANPLDVWGATNQNLILTGRDAFYSAVKGDELFGRAGTNEALLNKQIEAFHAYNCLPSVPSSEASCSASVELNLLEQRSLLRAQPSDALQAAAPMQRQNDLLLALLGLLHFEKRKGSVQVNKSEPHPAHCRGCFTTIGFTVSGLSG